MSNKNASDTRFSLLSFLWFGFFSMSPFIVLLIGYHRSIYSIPFVMYLWCFFVALNAGLWGGIGSKKILEIGEINKKNYWISAKTGMLIALKASVTSAIFISIYSPLFLENKSELPLIGVVATNFLFFSFGFLLFSWLIFGAGALAGMGLMFFKKYFI